MDRDPVLDPVSRQDLPILSNIQCGHIMGNFKLSICIGMSSAYEKIKNRDVRVKWVHVQQLEFPVFISEISFYVSSMKFVNTEFQFVFVVVYKHGQF